MNFHDTTSWPTTTDEALTLFDSLAPVTVEEMLGAWRGGEIPTQHPLDGVLGVAKWYGKEFRSADDGFPLVHQGLAGRFAANPALMPLGLAIHAPFLRNKLTTLLFLLSQPIISTKRPTSRLRMVEYRGAVSATMIYDAKPINDHFRKITDDQMLGLMDFRGMERPFFFTLTREVVAS